MWACRSWPEPPEIVSRRTARPREVPDAPGKLPVDPAPKALCEAQRRSTSTKVAFRCRKRGWTRRGRDRRAAAPPRARDQRKKTSGARGRARRHHAAARIRLVVQPRTHAEREEGHVPRGHRRLRRRRARLANPVRRRQASPRGDPNAAAPSRCDVAAAAAPAARPRTIVAAASFRGTAARLRPKDGPRSRLPRRTEGGGFLSAWSGRAPEHLVEIPSPDCEPAQAARPSNGWR